MLLLPIARERVCPNCGNKGVQRTRRQGLYERLVCLIRNVRPFRCDSCEHLFLAHAYRVPKQTSVFLLDVLPALAGYAITPKLALQCTIWGCDLVFP